MASGNKEKAKAGGTRGQLLEAACRVFAEKSYRDATVAEICRQAGANIALVNYHFGDKETLYAEAWRRAFGRALETHPADGGVPADAPAAERLRGRVLSLMRRIADPGNQEFSIIQREIASPTGLLAVVMHEAIHPIHLAFGKLIREMLGPEATEADVELCRMSIIAQCLHPVQMKRRHQLLAGGTNPPPPMLDLDMETIVDHILRFSLAGLREVRAVRLRKKAGRRKA